MMLDSFIAVYTRYGKAIPNGESLLDAWTFALCEIAFCAGIKTLDELKVMLDIGGSYAKRAC